MKHYIELPIVLAVWTSHIAAQADVNLQSPYYDSISVRGPYDMHSQEFITNFDLYYFRFEPSELELARVVTAWKDSMPIVEHAYLNPYHCIGTSFFHDSIYVSILERNAFLVPEHIELDIAALDTSISMEFHAQGTLAEIWLGTLPDTMIVMGYYEDGTAHYRGQYKDGERVGQWIYYYDIGTVEHIENWKSDKLDGNFISYYKSGAISSREQYDQNKRNGIAIFYSETGDIIRKEKYLNGVLLKE